jgi:hypothetical protein
VPHVRRPSIALVAAGCLTALAGALPGAAYASLVTPASCTISQVSQPFLSWGDTATYELLPGGDFEGSLDGWTLQGGAAQVADSDQFGVTGSVGSEALALPPGAVATAPAACVDLSHPDVRLFTRSDSPNATLRVRAMFDTADREVTARAGHGSQVSSDWQPTQPLTVHRFLVLPNSNGTAYITVQFQASGGTVYIDDALVDPRGRY